ncbi:CheR family methyltransferase [Pedobacter yulinensis]|uniref:CheR family methyltransferase n=1 Tax=Pedobacter yulinensis TaxID=2126353 RepID=UPI001EF97DA5|nr:CheR family methyltransferase [Pedobacter yulinensis]
MTKKTEKIKQDGAVKITKGKSFPIIGIGGSAGAVASIEKFFTHMPADSGMAFIIVMHLAADHQGQLAEIFRNFTPMPVHEVADGVQVEPDHVYIIPPDRDLGIHNRKLLLLGASKPNGYRQPIDYFLQSLADDQWNRAVAIIFSGMGSDGETGVRMIKEKLGMAMVEDPEGARYSSMPNAAIGTNLVDYVLSPEEMPLKLIQYVNHPVLSEEPSEQARTEIRNSTSVQKILMLLRSQTGHDFSLYKKSTIIRRIDRRVAFHQLPDYVHYVTYLRENPPETEILFNELLIGVTKFFRDAAAFDSLKNRITQLLPHKKSGEPVRAWVAGCSTGEEAYSVAMLLIECVEALKLPRQPKIQVFATDLDGAAVEHARLGIYRGNIVADVSEQRLARFFIKEDEGYRVKKELREMIVFAQHNLIKDAPFTRVDLLCCRNVMIYLTGELQRKIMPIFHYSLVNKGIMFMGPAETIGGFTELFAAADPKWKIFERKEGSATLNKMIDFPFHITRPNAAVSRAEETDYRPKKNSVADAFNKIVLDQFTPTSILLNDHGDILYSSGKSGNFLQLPRGEAVMNIHKMAREDLRYVLGNVIHQAHVQRGLVSINDVKTKEGNEVRLLRLHASPLEDSGMRGLMLLVIEDLGPVKKTNRRPGKPETSSRQIEEMEKELVYTKQQLHSTIEQMETSLEELKSTNEELQSTNEELQSTNEESLTTKEEMQSLNEELMTVNVQYQAKAEELGRLNNDMKNLLDATEIGTIFLNNELQILRFTPQIKSLFNIIPADIGRALSDIVANFDYALLEETSREVINKLNTKEIEIRTRNNEWFRVRVMPYRTTDNFISGAVITFTAITSYKKMEFRIDSLRNYAGSVMAQLKMPGAVLDSRLAVTWANLYFVQMFTEAAQPGGKFDDLVKRYFPEADAVALRKELLEATLPLQMKLRQGGTVFNLFANPFVNEEFAGPVFYTIMIEEE